MACGLMKDFGGGTTIGQEWTKTVKPGPDKRPRPKETQTIKASLLKGRNIQLEGMLGGGG